MQDEAQSQPGKGFICFMKCTAAAVNCPIKILPTKEQAAKIGAAARKLSSVAKESAVINPMPRKPYYDMDVFENKQFISVDQAYCEERMADMKVWDKQR